MTRHLRLIYSVYPALSFLTEYRLATALALKYGCKRVLDVGCGRGNLSKILRSKVGNLYYVGVDINDCFAGKWREHGNTEFVACDAGRLPVRTEFFDCVFFVNSIFYVGVDAIKDVSLSKVAVIIDIDPKYLHVALADLLESRLKG